MKGKDDFTKFIVMTMTLNVELSGLGVTTIYVFGWIACVETLKYAYTSGVSHST